jgi:hypothetical protein
MKHRLSEVALAITLLGGLIASVATVSWFRDTAKDVCSQHPFWNSGAIGLIPALCLLAVVVGFVGGRRGSPSAAVRYASYISPWLVLLWSFWLLSHFQLFPCGLF